MQNVPSFVPCSSFHWESDVSFHTVKTFNEFPSSSYRFSSLQGSDFSGPAELQMLLDLRVPSAVSLSLPEPVSRSESSCGRMLWTWIPTKPREKGPLFKITMGCPMGLWVITELARTCWMPFSPPDTILDISDPFGSPNPPNRDYSCYLLLHDWSPEGWHNLPKSQNGASSLWPQRGWFPGPCLSVIWHSFSEVGRAVGTQWLSSTSVQSLSSLWQKGASFLPTMKEQSGWTRHDNNTQIVGVGKRRTWGWISFDVFSAHVVCGTQWTAEVFLFIYWIRLFISDCAPLF